MKDTSWLSGFSEALKARSEQAEVERKEWEARLGEPALFVPDPEQEGHGIGYWTDGKVITGIRRYSNGYEKQISVQYEVDFLKKLLALTENI